MITILSGTPAVPGLVNFQTIQWERIKQLINHGVDVWVISSKDHVELFINEYSKEGDL